MAYHTATTMSLDPVRKWLEQMVKHGSPDVIDSVGILLAVRIKQIMVLNSQASKDPKMAKP